MVWEVGFSACTHARVHACEQILSSDTPECIDIFFETQASSLVSATPAKSPVFVLSQLASPTQQRPVCTP